MLKDLYYIWRNAQIPFGNKYEERDGREKLAYLNKHRRCEIKSEVKKRDEESMQNVHSGIHS